MSQYEPVGSLTKKVNSFAIRQKKLQNEEDSTDQEVEIVETHLGYEKDDEQEEEDDLMEFPSQKIQLTQEIGQGTFGKVSPSTNVDFVSTYFYMYRYTKH